MQKVKVVDVAAAVAVAFRRQLQTSNIRTQKYSSIANSSKNTNAWLFFLAISFLRKILNADFSGPGNSTQFEI
jgi:hypothetical protein